MQQKLFSLYFTLVIGFFQLLIAQTSDIKTTSAQLDIQGKNVPVEIFATVNGNTFSAYSNETPAKNYLIIVNKDNKEPINADYEAFILSTFANYKNHNYQFLTKDFKLIDNAVNINDIQNVKYMYHAVNQSDIIKSNDTVSLKTDFKIWDPANGINLGFGTLHFYSLMFVFAFGFGYILMKKIFKIDNVDEKFLDPLFTWTLVGTILGARLGHVIFYQPELFKEDFLSVFLPISTKGGLHFTGFSGLASHGATIALIFTTLYYSFKVIKKNPFWVYDRLGIVVALGGAFVRMGNFFNSEIIGKPVDPKSPYALLFPQQSSEYGVTIPRYPTQLFEAVGYVLLFVLLWFLYRKTDKKYQQGWLFGLFFIILWAIRFLVEFLKEPQGDEFIQFAGLNTGQVLSIPFMIAGLVIMLYSKNWKLEK